MGPGGLSSSALTSSRKSGSSGTTPSSTSKRASGTCMEEGGGLIVTRGLQEILDNDRKYRKAEEPTTADKGSKNSKTRRRGSGQAPNFVICYLCGRQFGSASIDFHRPQCYLKKMIEWQRADPAIRGPKPMTPEEHEKMMKARVASVGAAGGGYPGASKFTGGASSRRAHEIEIYNQIQMDTFNETSLAPCPNCGRTFLPDRLQVHLRSCKPGHTAKPVYRPTTANVNSSGSSSAAAATGSQSMKVNGGASPQATDAQERPIRASGTYAGPTGADPRAAGGGEDTTIRARGSYMIPEDAGADSVPPQAPSAKKPSRGPSVSNNNINLNVSPRGMSEDTTEEAEPRETVLDMEPDEVKPPSPRADTERRLSSVAILRGDPEMSGSSAPNRPASMEPSTVPLSAATAAEEERNESSNSNTNVVYSLSQSRGREHAAGSRPRKQGAASAPRTAPMPELVSEPRDEAGAEEVVEINSDEDELESTPVVGARGRMCKVVECGSEPEGHNAHTGSGGERRKWAPKKIPLNNVSRFKKVESRLKQQREAELAMFVPCRYCGRTFVPERIQKHEECCTERNKPPSRRSVQLKHRPSSAPTSTTKHTKSAPASASSSAANWAPHVAMPAVVEHKAASPSPAAASAMPTAAPAPAAVSAPTPGRAKFCGGCGVRVSSETQKFCTECGFKL
jgi:hypothetical protein